MNNFAAHQPHQQNRSVEEARVLIAALWLRVYLERRCNGLAEQVSGFAL